MAEQTQIDLGTKVEDSVTGFSGIAIARCVFLHGRVSIGISPVVGKDGKVGATEYFDLERVRPAKAPKRASRASRLRPPVAAPSPSGAKRSAKPRAEKKS